MASNTLHTVRKLSARAKAFRNKGFQAPAPLSQQHTLYPTILFSKSTLNYRQSRKSAEKNFRKKIARKRINRLTGNQLRRPKFAMSFIELMSFFSVQLCCQPAARRNKLRSPQFCRCDRGHPKSSLAHRRQARHQPKFARDGRRDHK